MANSSLEYFHKHQGPLLFGLITQADTFPDTIFKGMVVELLLGSPKLRRPEGAVQEDILLLVEDVASLRSRERQWELILSLALLEPKDDTHYRLRSEIPLASFFPTEKHLPRYLKDKSWPVEIIWAVLFPPEIQPAWTLRTIRSAILKGYGWLAWTFQFAYDLSNRLEGLPAFWQCERTEDRPMGFVRAVTSMGDALGALADSHYFSITLKGVPGNHGPILDKAIDWLMACGADQNAPEEWNDTVRAWNQGGFWPYDDQPEAAFPTVDATWDALLALGSVYDQRQNLQETYGANITLWEEKVRQAVIGATRFLLRMQLPGGGWGVYRYPNDTPPLPASAFSTAQTMLALHLTLLSNVFDSHGDDKEKLAEIGKNAENALRQAWDWILKSGSQCDGWTTWTPFFSDKVADVDGESQMRAGCWLGVGLLALHRRFADLRPNISPLLTDIVARIQKHWQVNHKKIAPVVFRVPMASGPREVAAQWANRLDVTVVQFLLDCFNRTKEEGGQDISFDASLWNRMEIVIGNLLQEQHPKHGHWNEPVEGKPLAAATMMAIQVLQNYLKAVPHLISG
ncbi:MAG: hypothetical protein HW380_1733 [Magnetococcales bacterium]|nr:hypothetical protein [Magnetococcales bacterium]